MSKCARTSHTVAHDHICCYKLLDNFLDDSQLSLVFAKKDAKKREIISTDHHFCG